MKFMKFVLLLFILMILAVIWTHIFNYWLAMTYFPVISTLLVATFHLFLVCSVTWVFYKVLKTKVS